MAEGNAQRVHAMLEACNRRDAEALAALCTPDVEFRPIVAALTGEVYRGEEGLRRWLAEVERRFPGSYARADEVEDLGDAAIASGKTRGRDLSYDWYVTFLFEDGRITSWAFHPSREHAERALAAAGESRRS